MNEAHLKVAGQSLGVWFAVLLGLALSVVAGLMVGNNAIFTVIVFSVVVLSTIWLLAAKERWWVLVPAAGTLGGYFYFGHKIYTSEVALLACLIPLGMSRAIRVRGAVRREWFHLPTAINLLAGYLVLHWVASNIYNKFEGTGGYGNVTRVYLNALGVIIFVLLFKRFGSSKYVPLALFLTYIAALFRVTVGILIYVTNAFAYVPVINYVLPGSTHSGGDDLRASGFALASVAICYFLIKRSFFEKTFHLLVLLGSCVAIAFGSGRTVIVLTAAMVIFAATLYRKIVPIILSLIVVSGIVILLNVHPALLNSVPFRVQRTFSILLLDKDEAARYGKAFTSDQWHEDLRDLGYAKWTASWHNFLFGTGIRPYDSALLDYIPGQSTGEELIESAAKVGAYESGWWTVIAVTGLVGLVLYLGVLLYLLRRLVPVLLAERISDHSHAFAFLAVFGIANWILLGWSNASFPVSEIMFGFLAVFALADSRRTESEAESSALSPSRLRIPPPEMASLARR